MIKNKNLKKFAQSQDYILEFNRRCLDYLMEVDNLAFYITFSLGMLFMFLRFIFGIVEFSLVSITLFFASVIPNAVKLGLYFPKVQRWMKILDRKLERVVMEK